MCFSTSQVKGDSKSEDTSPPEKKDVWIMPPTYQTGSYYVRMNAIKWL